MLIALVIIAALILAAVLLMVAWALRESWLGEVIGEIGQQMFECELRTFFESFAQLRGGQRRVLGIGEPRLRCARRFSSR